MYAIVKTGGHQYKVAVGDRLNVEKIPAEAGAEVALSEVLMVSGEDNQVTVGTPIVAGATVRARVVDQHRGEKLIVFKYKPKKR